MNELKIIQAAKINPKFDMTVENTHAIMNGSQNIFQMAYNYFCFGYAQGMQAQKAAQRLELPKAAKENRRDACQ